MNFGVVLLFTEGRQLQHQPKNLHLKHLCTVDNIDNKVLKNISKQNKLKLKICCPCWSYVFLNLERYCIVLLVESFGQLLLTY